MNRLIVSGAMALALSGLAASACNIQIRVACPNDRTKENIRVYVEGFGYAYTDNLGIAELQVPEFGNYKACVDTATLPAGSKLSGSACQNIKVVSDAPPVVEFVLSGDFCAAPPTPGPCWLTGGGTIGRTKGAPNYSFGGVVYPGCSPKAANGGNWNVIDHATGLHFQGQHIIVDACSGDPTSSPRVPVNIIDFHGEGIISGIGGNPDAKVPVTFIGRAIDNQEGGAGADQLFLVVTEGLTVRMQIGTSAAAPATISTGNLQIHISSCNN